MTRLLLTAVILFSLCAIAAAAESNDDVRTFELTAVAPPTPALKYQLLFENLPNRSASNAALLYMQAVLIMGPDAADKAGQALDAYADKNQKKFDSLADSLDPPGLWPVLDLAARAEGCDWEAPFREQGVETRLPYLSPLRDMCKVIKVRTLRQIEQGQAAEALASLRLGYEMARKIGREPTVMISALVSVNLTMSMNDALDRLMNSPQTPNLYWALRELPGQQAIMRAGFGGESLFACSLPHFSKVWAGQEISAAEWHEALDYVMKLVKSDSSKDAIPDPIKDAPPELIGRAQKEYVQAHHLTAEQASKIDPTVALGWFYFQQYMISFDNMSKLRGLPYPLLIAKGREYEAQLDRLSREQPSDPFFRAAPVLSRYVGAFARADRQWAALTTVEALRSYAAAHGGKLPERLEDVTDTPPADNPLTAKPFEYRLENGVATLADSTSKDTLTYTITIRK